jgi:hypothetical protein
MELISEKQLDELPQSIAEDYDPKIWGTCWYRANKDNKMVTVVFCGGRGAGKTYSLLKKADDLHRDKKDKKKFTINQLCFTAGQFKKRLRDDFDIGTVIALDDAGLALYNKDALTNIVKEIGKSLMTIRRKNPIILMSLPFFKMLEGHAKMFADMYVEIVDRDETLNQNLAKIQLLKKDYYSGEIYRYTMLKYETRTHPKFGVKYKVPIPEFFRIGMPRHSLYGPYEEYKKKALDAWEDESLAIVERLERKRTLAIAPMPKVTFTEVLTYVREHLAEFQNPKTHKVNAAKILEVYNGEDKPTIGMSMAELVARNLNVNL